MTKDKFIPIKREGLLFGMYTFSSLAIFVSGLLVILNTLNRKYFHLDFISFILDRDYSLTLYVFTVLGIFGCFFSRGGLLHVIVIGFSGRDNFEYCYDKLIYVALKCCTNITTFILVIFALYYKELTYFWSTVYIMFSYFILSFVAVICVDTSKFKNDNIVAYKRQRMAL